MLFSGSPAKVLKDQKIVALYPTTETESSWRVFFKSTPPAKFSNPPHEGTSKISSTHSVSPKFEHRETEKFYENFPKIEIETLNYDIVETGTANAVVRHQMNGERVQWHHATFGFPFASTIC